jgi:hypothetical protein
MKSTEVDNNNIFDPIGIPATANAHVAKRLQVPRACTNCRKMHAGCDTQRPCKRCKQNGLESSCSDIPRKKRFVKRKTYLSHVNTEHLVKNKKGTRMITNLFQVL